MDVWRPEPPNDDESPWSRLVAWIRFVGPTKVVASVAGVIVAAIVGWALIRPSSPGAEAALGTLAPSSTSSAELVPTTLAPDAPIIVHVAGSVKAPGVYRLRLGDRVVDAVTAAGGALPRAATDAVNLAAPVTDGERVYVPAIGEVVTATAVATSGSVVAGTTTAVVDVNTATADQLDALPGIGPSTAAAIVARRDEIGRFVGYDDLLSVPGIGPAKVDALRGLISF
ncbi:MAG: hypothetical protein RL547_1458 [Actinomycetota bacterium]|jgi:competence protein ComEA